MTKDQPKTEEPAAQDAALPLIAHEFTLFPGTRAQEDVCARHGCSQARARHAQKAEPDAAERLAMEIADEIEGSGAADAYVPKLTAKIRALVAAAVAEASARADRAEARASQWCDLYSQTLIELRIAANVIPGCDKETDGPKHVITLKEKLAASEKLAGELRAALRERNADEREFLRHAINKIEHFEAVFKGGAKIADGYPAAKVPEWELRRRLDDLNQAEFGIAPASPASGGEPADETGKERA